jgi:hypothetical protein
MLPGLLLDKNPQRDNARGTMTAKRITEIIDILNQKQPLNTGSHVTLFECVSLVRNVARRDNLWLHDSGSKMIGAGGEHSRYRCDVKTDGGQRVILPGHGKQYEDPKQAVSETIDELRAWICGQTPQDARDPASGPSRIKTRLRRQSGANRRSQKEDRTPRFPD